MPPCASVDATKIRLRAAQRGRSTEAEIRAILHAVAAEGESAGGAAMAALIAQSEAVGVRAPYAGRVIELVANDEGKMVGARVRQTGTMLLLRAKGLVVIAVAGFSFNRQMVQEHCSLIGDRAESFGIPHNDGSGILLGLVDRWETVAEMEKALDLPLGSLQHTLAEYDSGAASGAAVS